MYRNSDASISSATAWITGSFDLETRIRQAGDSIPSLQRVRRQPWQRCARLVAPHGRGRVASRRRDDMQNLLLRTSVNLARAWTHLYTWRAPSGNAGERRREIESDLWELANDADAGSDCAKAAHVIVRLVTGIADDLAWRQELQAADQQFRVRRAMSVMAAMLVVASLWIVPALFARGLRGRAQVFDCASAAAKPGSTAELRLQVIECAGAFFVRR